MEKSAKRIGEILVAKGLITEAQLYDALIEQRISDGFVGQILVERGIISDRQITEALSEQFSIPLINLGTQYIDMELARKFSSALIIDHKCFPILRNEDTITVAVVNPLNAVAISKIEEEARPLKVKFVLVLEEDLNQVIQNYRQQIREDIQRLLRRNNKRQ